VNHRAISFDRQYAIMGHLMYRAIFHSGRRGPDYHCHEMVQTLHGLRSVQQLLYWPATADVSTRFAK
jgi:hypothetical protein